MTRPHVGPQRSYVPWLAVTAGWGGHSLCSGGWPLARGPLRGSSAGPGPQPWTGREKGRWGGMSREKWGGARRGRGPAVMDRAGAGSAGPGSGSWPGHSPLSCSLPFLAAAALPIAATAAGAGPGAAARRVLAAAGDPGARWAAAAAPRVGCAGCGAATPAQPLLPASLRARPPGNLSPSPLLLSVTPPQPAAHWPRPS